MCGPDACIRASGCVDVCPVGGKVQRRTRRRRSTFGRNAVKGVDSAKAAAAVRSNRASSLPRAGEDAGEKFADRPPAVLQRLGCIVRLRYHERDLGKRGEQHVRESVDERSRQARFLRGGLQGRLHQAKGVPLVDLAPFLPAEHGRSVAQALW